MNGRVDAIGRALVPVRLKATPHGPSAVFDAWVDTGFTGELVLPLPIIQSLTLSQSGTVSAELANGEAVVVGTYSCVIDWFGMEQRIEVVASKGTIPLLGVGLLRKHRLTVDYESLTLAID
jgi:clan AA aspartic protease